MALQNIKRSLSRTSVLIASLMVVTSVYIGIAIMTQSFRFSIIDWVDNNIGGDIHISSVNNLKRALDPDLMENIDSMAEVQGISAYNIHRIFSKATGEVHVFSYQTDLSKKRWSWIFSKENELDQLMKNGWIFVSEIFAQKNDIEPQNGAIVTLETLKGPKAFKIAGIFRDFFMGGGRIIVSRETMKFYWGHDDITALQLFLLPGKAVNPVIEKVQGFIPDMDMVRVIPGLSIKKSILDVFDKTFIITSALQILTAIVALTGILNSVMALLLERSREMGILRACGAETRQVRRLLLIECGVCGLISGIMALPLGLFLSWVLIEIINRRAFGWTYDMVVSPGVLFQAVILSCVAAFVAGIFPAIGAGRIDIGQALRME